MDHQLIIYHNPKCAKSRAGLNYLTDKGISFITVNYLKEPLTAKEIKVLVQKTGLPVIDLIRKQEEYYKQHLKGKTLTDDEWCNVLAENPNLLQRPIVAMNQKAVLAQPPESIDNLLK